MTVRNFLVGIGAVLLAFTLAACASQASTTDLHAGMTPNEAVQAMGEPDLKDNVADPSHSGATVLRYTWVDAGKTAVFDSENKIETVQNVDLATKQQAVQVSQQTQMPRAFDPIETPLNYLFFPVKAGFNYLGAGLNCVAGTDCRKPQVTLPSG
jgi:hypothetical protein